MPDTYAEQVRIYFNNRRHTIEHRYVAKKGIPMNTFSKFLSLGLCASMVLAVPLFARDNTCCIVGSYIGTIDNQGDIQPVEVQFHKDGTATFFVFESSSTPTLFVGAWKQLGHECIKFCSASPTSPTSRISLNGNICFDNENCRNLTGTVTLSTEGTTPLAQETTPTISLQRVDCCS